MKETEARAKLEASRRRLEARFTEARDTLEREVGWAPRTGVWVVPLVAFAGGLALAGLLRHARRRALTD